MADDRYDKVTFHGRTVDKYTRAALLAVEADLGYELTITQGSYNAGGVGASKGTHDGGGAVDLAPFDRDNKVRRLRQRGFAAWYRSPAQGPWPAHIHAVQFGNEKLSSGAAHQISEYLAGRNGLASRAPDDGPRIVLRKFNYEPEDEMKPEDWTRLEKMLDAKLAAQRAEVAAAVWSQQIPNRVTGKPIAAGSLLPYMHEDLHQMSKGEVDPDPKA